MKIISEQHEKCQKCVYAKACDHKRMVACGLMELPAKMSAPVSTRITVSHSKDLLVKHDFREDMKKDLERALYKRLGCPLV